MGVFLVLRCFQCRHFRVIQRRKDRKWTCKLCGGRQSIIRCLPARSIRTAGWSCGSSTCAGVRWSRASARTAPGRGEATGGAVVEPLGAGDTLGFVECGGQQTHSTLQASRRLGGAFAFRLPGQCPATGWEAPKIKMGDSEGESDFSDGGRTMARLRVSCTRSTPIKRSDSRMGERRRRRKKKKGGGGGGRELEQDPESSMARLTGKLASQRPPVVQREPQHSKPKYRAGGPAKNTKTRSRWGRGGRGGGQSSKSDDDGVQLSAAQFQQKPSEQHLLEPRASRVPTIICGQQQRSSRAGVVSTRSYGSGQRARSALNGSAQSSPRHAPALPSGAGTNDAGDAVVTKT